MLDQVITLNIALRRPVKGNTSLSPCFFYYAITPPSDSAVFPDIGNVWRNLRKCTHPRASKACQQLKTTMWRALPPCLSKNQIFVSVFALLCLPWEVWFNIFSNAVYRHAFPDRGHRYVPEVVCCGLRQDRCVWLKPHRLGVPKQPNPLIQTWEHRSIVNRLSSTASSLQEGESLRLFQLLKIAEWLSRVPVLSTMNTLWTPNMWTSSPTSSSSFLLLLPNA